MGDRVSAHARITHEPLSADSLLGRVRDPGAGAVVLFSGVTRTVDALEYEGYVHMAETEMLRIVVRALDEHGLCAAAAEHRLGTVGLGEASVLVAASAPHRGAAFAGSRAIIDEVKRQVPVWKREEGSWKHEYRPDLPADR